MKKLTLLLFVAMIFISCKDGKWKKETIRVVNVPHVIHDTVNIGDLIVIHDTVFINTRMITKRSIHDNLYDMYYDSINKYRSLWRETGENCYLDLKRKYSILFEKEYAYLGYKRIQDSLQADDIRKQKTFDKNCYPIK